MAVVTRYVNTASSPGGDGTTAATTGANRAYASLSEWEADEQTDLVTATDTHVVNCVGSTADTARAYITGWTTDATYFITVNGDNTTGAYSAAHYRIENTTTGGYQYLMHVRESFTVFNDIQLEQIAAHNAAHGFYLFSCTDVTFKRCLSKGVVTGGSSTRGFHVETTGVKIYGCLAIGWSGVSHVGIKFGSSTPLSYLYNTTVDDCTIGVSVGYLSTIARNVLTQNCGNGFSGTAHASSSNNASDIASDAPGSSPQTGTATFVDAAGGDYQPASGDTVAKENGVDLSGTFTFDLAGNTWPATWSIGCLIPAAAGGTGPVLALSAFGA